MESDFYCWSNFFSFILALTFYEINVEHYFYRVNLSRPIFIDLIDRSIFCNWPSFYEFRFFLFRKWNFDKTSDAILCIWMFADRKTSIARVVGITVQRQRTKDVWSLSVRFAEQKISVNWFVTMNESTIEILFVREINSGEITKRIWFAIKWNNCIKVFHFEHVQCPFVVFVTHSFQSDYSNICYMNS